LSRKIDEGSTMCREPEQSIPPPRHGSRRTGRASRLAAPPRVDLAHSITKGRRAGGIAPSARPRRSVLERADAIGTFWDS
jgi:hypothetical protein